MPRHFSKSKSQMPWPVILGLLVVAMSVVAAIIAYA